MNVETKKLATQDIDQFIELIRVFEEVFEMKNFNLPERDYLQQLLAQTNFLVFAALSDGKVVGGLTAYTLQQYYSQRPLVYVYDLAVQTAYQRRGIGSRLMSALTGYCQRTGVEEVFVQADQDDDHAIEFYRATGGRAEQVVHFNYPLPAR